MEYRGEMGRRDGQEQAGGAGRGAAEGDRRRQKEKGKVRNKKVKILVSEPPPRKEKEDKMLDFRGKKERRIRERGKLRGIGWFPW